jgi:hypothetical protein
VRDVLAARSEIADWPDAVLLAELRERAAPLPSTESGAVDLLLGQAIRRGLDLDAALLGGWVRRRGTARAAIRASALSTDPAVVPLLRDRLDDERDAPEAAVALCRLRDTASTPRVLDVLTALVPDPEQVLAVQRIVAALDLMGDPAAARALLALITTAPERLVYYLGRTVRRLTHRSPLAEPGLDGFRRAWARVDLSERPDPVVHGTVLGDRNALLTVHDGRDAFALDDLDAGPASAWATWSTAWTQGGQDVWVTGSGCGTCEVLLAHDGWPPAEAVALAQVAREAVADVTRVDQALVDALTPVLAGAATGRYHLRLRDLPLRRGDLPRDDADEDPPVDLPEQVYGSRGADGRHRPLWVAPTQPAERLDEATVTAFAARIAAGRRPAVLVAAHATRRWPMEADEAIDHLTGFVLDGHHKLAAYERVGVPARVLWLCDLTPRISPGVEDVEALLATLLDDRPEDRPDPA